MTKEIEKMKLSGRTTGERLIQARGRLSRKDLAQKANVHEQSIVKWENDKSEPSIENIKKLAKACEVSKFILAFGNEKYSKNDEKELIIEEIMSLTEEDRITIKKITRGLKLTEILKNE